MDLKALISPENLRRFSNEQPDKAVWAMIGVAAIIYLIVFSIFTTTPISHNLVRVFAFVFVSFLPGYIIVKLFLDRLEISEYKAVDRFIMSFGFSLLTVQTLVFLLQYIVQFGLFSGSLNEKLGFKVEQETIRSDWRAIGAVLFVIAVSFGIKYYQKYRQKKRAEGSTKS